MNNYTIEVRDLGGALLSTEYEQTEDSNDVIMAQSAANAVFERLADGTHFLSCTAVAEGGSPLRFRASTSGFGSKKSETTQKRSSVTLIGPSNGMSQLMTDAAQSLGLTRKFFCWLMGNLRPVSAKHYQASRQCAEALGYPGPEWNVDETFIIHYSPEAGILRTVYVCRDTYRMALATVDNRGSGPTEADAEARNYV